MEKKLRKLLALFTALAICAAQVAVPVFAIETESEQTVIEIDGGTMTVTQQQDTSTGDGTTTITDTTTHEWNQELTGSSTTTTNIVGSETSLNVSTTDSEGRPLYESESVSGSETTTVTTQTTTDSQSVDNPVTETTDNDFIHDSDADTDTGWVTNSGETTQDTYTDAELSQDPGDVTLNLTQKKDSAIETIYLDLEQAVEDNIAIPEAGESITKNEDGSVTTTFIDYIYAEDNKTVIGYNKAVTTTRTEITEDQEYTPGTTDETDSTPVESDPEMTNSASFLLPAKPTGGTEVAPDGSVSVSTVENIFDENENLIGYTTVTVTTHPDGTVTNSSKSIYGTEILTETSETTTSTTTTATTELTKDRVTTTTSVRFLDAEGFVLVWDGVNWVYSAELGDVNAGKNHGDVDITPLTPTKMVLDGKEYVLNRSNSTVKPVGSHTSPAGYDYNYTGVRGEGSEFDVKTSNWYDSEAHMFQLKVGNDKFYVYCVDFATTATPNYNYTIENVADATYYGDEESKHIQAIGTYGYWGTTGTDENGKPVQGSLQALKNNLTAARSEAIAAGKTFPLTEKQINDLTEGEALTATQAAFWTYGNNGTTTIDKTQATKTITGLYQWLIAQEAPVTESTDIIEADEFAQKASITVKDKATNADGSTKTVKGNDVYKTDVSFTIDVTQSSLTGNLKVSVVQNGKVIKEIQLATADSNILGKVMAGGKEVGTTVTFTDLELIEGMKFTINLDGTQDLEEGVYIYTSEKINGKPSQTFVGLAQGEQSVDLSVDMKFTVTEPGVQIKDPGASPGETRVETMTERKTDTETTATTTHDTATVTLTVEQTKREWNSFWEKEYTYAPPAVPEFPIPEEVVEIEDEEVPLADAPQTGDISFLFAAISTLSLGGLFLLNRKRDDEE